MITGMIRGSEGDGGEKLPGRQIALHTSSLEWTLSFASHEQGRQKRTIAAGPSREALIGRKNKDTINCLNFAAAARIDLLDLKIAL